MEKDEVIEFVKQMKPRDHVIFIYTTPEDKYSVLFSYLKTGLDRGEGAAYVAGQETCEQVRQAMERFGIDVNRYEKNAALKVIDYRDWYIIGGKFDPQKTLELWKNMLHESKRKGLKSLRVTGEMACFFENEMVKELLEYEASLHRTLEISMMAICAYDQAVFGKVERPDVVEVLLELLKAHSTAIIMGPWGGVVRTVS